MTAEHEAILKGYLEDAEGKLAEIPKRIEEEAQLAADEGRKPRPVQPYTEVEPKVLEKALAATNDWPPDLKETHKTVTRVCRTQAEPFAMLSWQLAGLLKAAGIGSPAPAPKPE